MNKFILFPALAFLLLFNYSFVNAQSQPLYPTYVVQSGDTLSSIASQFGTSVEELIQVNQITNPDAIDAGTELKIPSFEGIQGVLEITPVPLGGTIQRLSAINDIPIDLLTKLNLITSPEEVYVGMNMIIPNISADQQNASIFLNDTQSLLEMAVLNNSNPWEIVERNMKETSLEIIPNEILYSTQLGSEENSFFLPGITDISFDPLPLTQGSTSVIRITTKFPMTFTGSLGNYELHFFPLGENEVVALQGTPAQATVGPIGFQIQGINPEDNSVVEFSQNILLYSGNFGEDSPLSVDPKTIDPVVISSEEETIDNLIHNYSPQKQWSGVFGYPLDDPCYGSPYGRSRIYNGTYLYYHTGMDFTVCSSNINIYASAPGTVVFAGPLIIRGNTVIIDHGWGIFTGYYHQSQILVQVGDHVEAGQTLGYVGTTGRSTGYHVHLDVWVSGVQVNPQNWLERAYP
jgi:murein DD-endopeptidase MepM/ murein hydrolase activator NlpD